MLKLHEIQQIEPLDALERVAKLTLRRKARSVQDDVELAYLFARASLLDKKNFQRVHEIYVAKVNALKDSATNEVEREAKALARTQAVKYARAGEVFMRFALETAQACAVWSSAYFSLARFYDFVDARAERYASWKALWEDYTRLVQLAEVGKAHIVEDGTITMKRVSWSVLRKLERFKSSDINDDFIEYALQAQERADADAQARRISRAYALVNSLADEDESIETLSQRMFTSALKLAEKLNVRVERAVETANISAELLSAFLSALGCVVSTQEQAQAQEQVSAQEQAQALEQEQVVVAVS